MLTNWKYGLLQRKTKKTILLGVVYIFPLFLVDEIELNHDFAVLKLLTKAVSVTKRQTKLNFFAQGVSSFNSAEVKFLDSTFCIVIKCLKLAPHYNPKYDIVSKLYLGEIIFLLRM